jgi:hypothetical protein
MKRHHLLLVAIIVFPAAALAAPDELSDHETLLDELTALYDTELAAARKEKVRTITAEMLRRRAHTRIRVCRKAMAIQPEKDPRGWDQSLPAEEHLARGLENLHEAIAVLRDSRKARLKPLPRDGERDMWFGGVFFIHSDSSPWQPKEPSPYQWGKGRSMEFEETWADYGLDYIYCWNPLYRWRGIEPAEGVWDYEDEEYYLSELDRIGMHIGLSVYEGVRNRADSPDWFKEKYGDKLADRWEDGNIPGAGMPLAPIAPSYAGENTEWLPAFKQFMQNAVKHASTHSCVVNYCFAGEQLWWGRSTSYHPVVLKGFPAWLRETYGTVEALNEHYGASFASFEEIQPPRVRRDKYDDPDWGKEHGVARTGRVVADYHTYTEDVLTDYERAKTEWIRAIDDTRPMYGGKGPDIYYKGGGMDRAGYNGWKIHPLERGLTNCDTYTRLASEWPLNLDLCVSISGRPGYAVEFNTLEDQEDEIPRALSPEELRRFMWSAIGHGLKGGAIWGLRHAVGYRPHFAVMDRDNLPLETGAELIHLNNQTRILSGALSGSLPPRGPVAIYLPHATFDIKRSLVNTYPWAVELHGLHHLLNRMGYNLRFVSDLDIDAVDAYRVLVMPWSPAMPERTIERIDRFVRDGGRVVAFGAPARWNRYRESFPAWPGAAFANLFGAIVTEEVEAPGRGFSGTAGVLAGTTVLTLPDEYQLDPETLGHGRIVSPAYHDKPPTFLKPAYTPWRHVLKPNGADIIAAWDDGAPAVIENRAGKGTAYLVSTLMGVHYNTAEDAEKKRIREVMQKLLGDIRPFVSSANPAVETALLKNKNGHFLVLVNHADTPEDVSVRIALETSAPASPADLLRGRKATLKRTNPGRQLNTCIAPKDAQLYWLP